MLDHSHAFAYAKRLTGNIGIDLFPRGVEGRDGTRDVLSVLLREK